MRQHRNQPAVPQGGLAQKIAEAYEPRPFEGQVERVDISLVKSGGDKATAQAEAAEDAATDERSTMSRQ